MLQMLDKKKKENLKEKDELINDFILRIRNVEDKQIKSEAPVKPYKKFKCKNCDIF